MALTAYTLCTIYARNVTALALSSPIDVINMGRKQSYTSGTGAQKIQLVYYYSGSLAASATMTFRFDDGSLSDNLGNALNYSYVKTFAFNVLTTVTGCTIATAGAANFAMASLFTAPHEVHPYGQQFVSAPMNNASAGSKMKVIAGSGGTLSFSFVLLGN